MELNHKKYTNSIVWKESFIVKVSALRLTERQRLFCSTSYPTTGVCKWITLHFLLRLTVYQFYVVTGMIWSYKSNLAYSNAYPVKSWHRLAHIHSTSQRICHLANYHYLYCIIFMFCDKRVPKMKVTAQILSSIIVIFQWNLKIDLPSGNLVIGRK